jgi:hypothetical protein
VVKAPLLVRQRRQERGAAVFIVVMVITLLTAVGIFAARATSLSDVAAGFEREAAQTSYVTQLAGNTVAAEMGSPGMATVYVQRMRSNPELCQSNGAIVGAPCYRLFKSDLDARTTAAGGEPLLDATSLSSAGTLQSDFLVEMTSPGPAAAPIAGTDLSNNTRFQWVSVTLSTTGLVMPATAAACGSDASIGAGRARSVIVVGPIAP